VSLGTLHLVAHVSTWGRVFPQNRSAVGTSHRLTHCIYDTHWRGESFFPIWATRLTLDTLTISEL